VEEPPPERTEQRGRDESERDHEAWIARAHTIFR